MITPARINDYYSVFPKDSCAFLEPGNDLYIVSKETGIGYISPKDEDDSIFLDRLERCKKDGKNYFYEEWKEYKPVYEPSVYY